MNEQSYSDRKYTDLFRFFNEAYNNIFMKENT